MILVLLGTQNNSFIRLLKEIEKCVENKTIKEDVIVQAGYTEFNSKKMKILDFISSDELTNLIQEANFIITHGGVGSIVDCLKLNKKIIAVPRLAKYNEHVNNHQTQIINDFDKKGYIIGLKDVTDLSKALKKIDNFTPKKYSNTNNRIINIISDYIDKF